MWVKICGITNRDDACAIAEFGPDAIGLNFYEPSRRYVSPDQAREIVAALPEAVEPIGLFVNHPQAEIRRICKHCGLKMIQLHGDETAEFIVDLAEFKIIRALRIGGDGLPRVADELATISTLGIRLSGCLIDAHVTGAYGGTGQTAPWSVLATEWNSNDWPPLILAGGLNPANVADAVREVHPWGVDVASGVEAQPGRQNLAKVRRFIQQARSAHDSPTEHEIW